MKNVRTIALSLALGLTVLAPAAALAKHGADDPSGDDRGGQRVVDDSGDRGGGGGRDDSSGRRDSTRSRSATRVRRATGTCTGSSTAKLKAKPDDGRLEAELEVDQNRNGVTWTVSLRRNGTVVTRARPTTVAPSGSFSVERKIANPAGTDTISARAVSPTGEVCTASVTI